MLGGARLAGPATVGEPKMEGFWTAFTGRIASRCSCCSVFVLATTFGLRRRIWHVIALSAGVHLRAMVVRGPGGVTFSGTSVIIVLIFRPNLQDRMPPPFRRNRLADAQRPLGGGQVAALFAVAGAGEIRRDLTCLRPSPALSAKPTL